MMGQKTVPLRAAAVRANLSVGRQTVLHRLERHLAVVQEADLVQHRHVVKGTPPHRSMHVETQREHVLEPWIRVVS